MSFGRSGGGGGSVEAEQVEFAPKDFELSPFGESVYEGGRFITRPSGVESQGISTRQRLINELLPELGKTNEQRAGQIQQFTDLFTKKLLDQALPLIKGSFTSRGLEGSTAEGRASVDAINDSIERGIFAGEDLIIRDEQSKLGRLGGLEAGLQQAFNRLLGISQQGKALNDQFFQVENANADRRQSANVQNASLAQQNNQNKFGALGDIAGLGSLAAFSNISPGGGTKGTSTGQQALQSTLSKTGGKSSSAGEAFKDPNTYIQLATLAAMAACWVAARIYGGWDKPETINVRNYIVNMAGEKLRDFYIRYGQAISENLTPEIEGKLKPHFERMAEKGRLLMEAYNARN